MDIGAWIYTVMSASVGWLLIGTCLGAAIGMVASAFIRHFRAAE